MLEDPLTLLAYIALGLICLYAGTTVIVAIYFKHKLRFVDCLYHRQSKVEREAHGAD